MLGLPSKVPLHTCAQQKDTSRQHSAHGFPCFSNLTVLGRFGRFKVRAPSYWWYLFASNPRFAYSANDGGLLHCLTWVPNLAEQTRWQVTISNTKYRQLTLPSTLANATRSAALCCYCTELPDSLSVGNHSTYHYRGCPIHSEYY